MRLIPGPLTLPVALQYIRMCMYIYIDMCMCVYIYMYYDLEGYLRYVILQRYSDAKNMGPGHW